MLRKIENKVRRQGQLTQRRKGVDGKKEQVPNKVNRRYRNVHNPTQGKHETGPGGGGTKGMHREEIPFSIAKI